MQRNTLRFLAPLFLCLLLPSSAIASTPPEASESCQVPPSSTLQTLNGNMTYRFTSPLKPWKQE